MADVMPKMRQQTQAGCQRNGKTNPGAGWLPKETGKRGQARGGLEMKGDLDGHRRCHPSDSLQRAWETDSVGCVILLAEYDEPSLAAKKKRQLEPSKSLTSTPKTRVWNFGNIPSGRPCSDLNLSWEIATGSVQYTYRSASGRGEFLSRDPLSGAEFKQGTNLYAYCGNNYLNSIDPTGMCLKSLWNDLVLGTEVAGGVAEAAFNSINPFSSSDPLSHLQLLGPDYTGPSLSLTMNSTPPGSLVGTTDTLQYNFPSSGAPLGSLTNTADVGGGLGTGVALTLNANFSNGVDPSGAVTTSSYAGGDTFGAAGSMAIGSNGGSTASVGFGFGVGAGASTSMNAVTQNVFGK